MCRHVATALHPGLYRVCYVSLTTGTCSTCTSPSAGSSGFPPSVARQAPTRAIRTGSHPPKSPAWCARPSSSPSSSSTKRSTCATTSPKTSGSSPTSSWTASNALCLLLVGLTELRRRLAMAVHESLSQRLVVRHHLTGLDRSELDAYLTHRLRCRRLRTPPVRTPRHRGAVPERARPGTARQPHRPLRPSQPPPSTTPGPSTPGTSSTPSRSCGY